MQCIGRTGKFTETITISGITRVWNGFLNILTFHSSDVERHPIEIMHRGDAVFVLPVDRVNGNVYLVRQPRHALALINTKGVTAVNTALYREQSVPDPYTIPFKDILMLDVPAGMIDGRESPADAALRELLEETGIHCDSSHLTLAGWSYASIGGSTERLWLFIANVGDHDSVSPFGDGDEQIEVYKMSFEEAFSLLDGDLIVNAGGRLVLEIFRRQCAERRLKIMIDG